MNPELAPIAQIPPGRYRHYKGGLYEVLGTARHSETLESMVVYRTLSNESGLWVRPATMFLEPVQFRGTWHTRFEWLSENE